MDESVWLPLYGGLKFVAYSSYCFFGLKLAAAGRADARRPTVWRAAALGALRWCIGLAVGVFVFFALAPRTSGGVWQQYFLVYVPVRIVEWGFMALLVGRMAPPRWRVAAWIAGGILVSFATDFVSPDMIEHGRFCVGRCLC